MMLPVRLKAFHERLLRFLWNRRQGPVRLAQGNGGHRALLSYIVTPFSPAARILHCNHIEAVCMAAALGKMGYAVDVIDYKSRKRVDYGQYDLVLGFGQPFVASFACSDFTGKRVIYLTGASPEFSNRAEALRLAALRQRRGVLLQPRREVYWPWVNAAINADGVMVTGNQWTMSTYAVLGKRVDPLPVPHVALGDTDAMTESAGVAGDGKRFIWFSGAGAVHKGLDLVLEAMDLAPASWHLDVCGPLDGEDDFMALYGSHLHGNKKISYHGFVAPGSPAFHEVIRRNSFVVFPSCSEGGASSVITCMAYGLLPVVTEQSSVDADGLVVMIDEASPRGVFKAMAQASELPDEELLRRAGALRKIVQERHSAAAYEAAFSAALSRILAVTPETERERL